MTIKDIAHLSGYSVGTVSRVLNNHPDVSAAARERVLAVVQEQNFQPNSNARHLKMRGKSAVAVLVKGSQNMLFADILERIQSLLRDDGEEAFVCYLDEDANEVAYAVQVCRERRPKGLIFLGGDLEFFQKDFARIAVPSVLLTNSAQSLSFPNLSSFTTDDFTAAGQVVDFLVSQGHRHLGVLGGNLSNAQISSRRIQGCQARLAAYRLPFDQELQYEPCRYSMAAGYHAAMRLLRRDPALTAIFALGDVIALGAMRAIYDLGLRIPENISLVGYDGIATSRYSVPRLTTIQQDTQELASRGVKALLRRIRREGPPVHEIIPFQLIAGESVLRLGTH